MRYLGVVEIIFGRCVHWHEPCGSMVSSRVVIKVHQCESWRSLGSFGVVGFTRAHPGGRSVHLGSFGSLRCAFESMGSSGVVATTHVRTGSSWVRPGLLGSLARSLGVVGFICGRWVHSREPLGSLGSLACALCVFRFIRGRWVHSRVPLGSLRSLSLALGVVVYILDRWVHSDALWGSFR